MTAKLALIPALAAALTFGCASARPPPELLSAQASYARAAAGPAAELAPSELMDAQLALDEANREFELRGDRPEVRDRAYVALRKAEIAAVTAQAQLESRKLADAQKQTALLLEKQARAAQARLAQTERELEEARGAAAAEPAKPAEPSEPTGSIRDDERGTVVTVLFEMGDASLTAPGKALLDKGYGKVGDRPVVIEGHTDSTGSAELNQQLSTARAEAARDYLIEKGVPKDKITVNGMGETQPVGPNTSDEDRARNRRVEVIIKAPPAVSAR